MKWKNTNAKRLPGRFLFSHASLVSVCEQLCLLCSSHCIPAFIWFSLTSNAQTKSVNHIFPHLIVRLNSTLIKMRLLSLKINAALLFIIYFPDCQDGINAIVNMQDYFYWEDIVSILFLITQIKLNAVDEKYCIFDVFMILLANEILTKLDYNFSNGPVLTILYVCQSWHTYSIVLRLSFIYHANFQLHLDLLKWDCVETTGKRGQERREKGIQDRLACIITLSRWHIYRLCQRGHAFCRSKRSEVWKSQLQHTGWPFNNYYHIPSTHYRDGDCDSTTITTLSCQVQAETSLLCDGGDSVGFEESAQ